MVSKETVTEFLNDSDKLENLIKLQLQENPKHILAFLAEDEDSFFEILIGMLDDAIRLLEEDAGNINMLSEDALSGLVRNNLGSSFILKVSREEHSKGHVDLTVTRTTDGIKVLGESKIWDGYGYHIKGCKQLLTYSTGRNKNTFILEFFKDNDMYKKMGKLYTNFDTKKPLNSFGVIDISPKSKGSFVSMHLHSSGSEISIAHTCCNLFLL